MSADTSQVSPQVSQHMAQDSITVQPAQKGTVPANQGVFIILSVTVALLALYYHGNLSKEWLNRSGMIIGMLTGLLFAPAVLDTTGFFGRAADWMEQATQRLYNLSSAYLPRVAKLFDSLAGRGVISVLVCLGLSVGIAWGLLSAGFSFYLVMVTPVFPISILFGLVDIVHSLFTKKKVSWLANLLAVIVFPLLFPIIVCAIPVIFFARLVLQFTSTVSAGMHGTIVKREPFRSALIGWGILVFAMSFLLQFVASF
jgi:hypothetical protein